ncbi:hypothetical protein KCP75_19885 [Salmonella enterica subsp. enterica]|nr:hypothetical protein KCP75_19885 [Salmonella enterica subsp. enterica]
MCFGLQGREARQSMAQDDPSEYRLQGDLQHAGTSGNAHPVYPSHRGREAKRHCASLPIQALEFARHLRRAELLPPELARGMMSRRRRHVLPIARRRRSSSPI